MRRWVPAVLVFCASFAFAAAQEGDFAETAPPKVNLPLGGDISPDTETPAPDTAVPEAPDPLIDEIGRYWDDADPDAGDGTETDAGTREGDSRAGMLLRGVMSLFGTLAVILLVYTGIKRWGRKTPLLAGQSLGNVMGRLSLTPHASLHFVRTNDEVLVIGVTQHSVTLLRTFEGSEFAMHDTRELERPDPARAELSAGVPFLDELKDARGSMGAAQGVDEELDLLKGDLERLKQYFQESSRGRDR